MPYFSSWKRFLAGLVIVSTFVVTLPNVLTDQVWGFLPRWYAGLHVPLRFDLRGGTRLVVQLPQDKADRRDHVISVMKLRLEQSTRDIRNFTVTRQGRHRICIETPDFFDVQFLRYLLAITARFSLYEEYIIKLRPMMS